MLQELKEDAPYTLFLIKEGGEIVKMLLVFSEYDPETKWYIFTVPGTDGELLIISIGYNKALIFEGHEVPVKILKSSDKEIQPAFTFLTDDALSLREYIELHCYGSFPESFASLFYLPITGLNTSIPIPLFPFLQ